MRFTKCSCLKMRLDDLVFAGVLRCIRGHTYLGLKVMDMSTRSENHAHESFSEFLKVTVTSYKTLKRSTRMHRDLGLFKVLKLTQNWLSSGSLVWKLHRSDMKENMLGSLCISLHGSANIFSLIINGLNFLISIHQML